MPTPILREHLNELVLNARRPPHEDRIGTQRTFAGLAWSQKGKVTRREQFLAEMDRVIRWAQLIALIAPYYPKAGKGRQPLGLEKMLRIYFLQQWFNLSDPQAEDAIYDSESMRRFAGVELSEDVVPDETTILRFRHLLEEYHLTAAIFATVRDLLAEKRLLLQSGTIRRCHDHRGRELDQELPRRLATPKCARPRKGIPSNSG